MCTFRRDGIPSETPSDHVIVINAGTIAAARPLALELARQADCSVVTYTHAGLCTLSDQGKTRRQPDTPFKFLFSCTAKLLGLSVALDITGDDAPLFSSWALPPVPLRADPTSEAESEELVAVLRHIGASKGE